MSSTPREQRETTRDEELRKRIEMWMAGRKFACDSSDRVWWVAMEGDAEAKDEGDRIMAAVLSRLRELEAEIRRLRAVEAIAQDQVREWADLTDAMSREFADEPESVPGRNVGVCAVNMIRRMRAELSAIPVCPEHADGLSDLPVACVVCELEAESARGPSVPEGSEGPSETEAERT